MSEVDGSANLLIDFQVSRDESKGRHEFSGLPGRGVGFADVDGVRLGALESGVEEFGVLAGAVEILFFRGLCLGV